MYERALSATAYPHSRQNGRYTDRYLAFWLAVPDNDLHEVLRALKSIETV